jgi:drug/metabolite transporter (DMT)-like permease
MLIFKINSHRRQIFGVLIGFIGCILLVLFGDTDNTTENYYYAFLILLAALFYGINVNLIKKYLSNLSPLTISTGNFTVLVIPAIMVLIFSGFLDISGQATVHNALIYIGVLGIVGTGLSNILFFKLIQISSPVFASSVTYIIPVVAIVLGYFVMKETLNFIQGMGAFIVLIGVYFSSKK